MQITSPTTLRVEWLLGVGLDRRTLCGLLGIAPSTLSLKVHGKRPWMQREIDTILGAARRIDPSVGYDDLFSPAPSAEAIAS